MSETQPMRAMIIGAHPDDCEIRCGGTAALWRRRGWSVAYVSVTTGDAGHHAMPRAELARRRAAELAASAGVIGAEPMILGIPDGEVVPSLEHRLILLRAMRAFRPDLVVTHRPNDYHPDHRYTSQLVQDATFLLRVPHAAPEAPITDATPAVFYCWDEFQKPTPFAADVAVDIDPVLDLKLRQLLHHESQFFEWLPWLGGQPTGAPADEAARVEVVRSWLSRRFQPSVADACRELLSEIYGPQRGSAVAAAEAFERCEYGRAVTDDWVRNAFTSQR